MVRDEPDVSFPCWQVEAEQSLLEDPGAAGRWLQLPEVGVRHEVIGGLRAAAHLSAAGGGIKLMDPFEGLLKRPVTHAEPEERLALIAVARGASLDIRKRGRPRRRRGGPRAPGPGSS